VTVNNPTDNYGWQMPDEGGDEDTWGTETNELIGDLAGAIESVDEILAGLQGELDIEQGRISDADSRTSQLEGSAPRPAYARVWMGVGQNISKATKAVLNWDTESFQKETLWGGLSSDPSRLTIPANFDGLFTVRGVVRFPFGTGQDEDSNEWYARILKNGDTDNPIAEARIPWMNQNSKSSAAVDDQTLIVEALVDAVGGDYFEIEVRYNWWGNGRSTESLTGGAANTYFEIYRHRSPILSLQPGIDTVQTSINNSTDSHTVAMPAVVSAGNLLLMIFSTRGELSHSTPAGWTKVFFMDNIVTTSSIYTKTATGAEGGTSVVIDGTTGKTSAAIVYSMTDVDHGESVEATGTFGSEGSDDSPPITPSWGPREATYFCVCCDTSDPIDSPTAPTGYGNAILLEGGTNGDQGLQVAYKKANVTTEDPGEWGGTNINGSVMTIAVPGVELT
jgi:hypothetical protein